MRGRHVTEFNSILSSTLRLRISGSQGDWVRASWFCGCRAEGPGADDVLLMERCHDHRAVFSTHDATAAVNPEP
jgi:hypothetical protein